MAETELLVIGAGPGGLAAAIEAAKTGIKVTVLDENRTAGGQIHRQVPPEFASGSFSHPKGWARQSGALKRREAATDVFDEARGLSIDFRFGATAWGCFEPGVIEVAVGDNSERIAARCMVLATGAYDRPIPFPGWTLPGVFTVGGAQALLKGQRLLIGRRVLLAGLGPLLLVVASQLCEAGAHVVAVVEPANWLDVLPRLPALLAVPNLALDGVRYHRTLRAAGVPWLSRSVLVRTEGAERVERAVVARVDEAWRPLARTERVFEVDAVCVGYGLLPSLELARLMGVQLEYAAASRTWIPQRDADLQSSVPGVFVIGDGAGIGGAAMAVTEGRIAGIAIAQRLAKLHSSEATQRAAPHRARRSRLRSFTRAIEGAYRLRPGLFTLADGETTVCRCEEVTRSGLETAFAEGAETPAQLRAWTGAAMGPCQGRMCSSFIAEWVAAKRGVDLGSIEPAGHSPIAKPVVSLGALGEIGGLADRRTGGPTH